MRRHGRRDANEPQHVQILDGMKVPSKRLEPIVPGWPDYLAVICGVPHFPEFKTEDGELTTAQLNLRQTLANAGVKLEDYFPVLVETKETIAWVARRRQALWKTSSSTIGDAP